MMMGITLWLQRAVWLMLLASAIWCLYMFALDYSSCRASDWGQVVCFFFALILSMIQTLVFMVMTVIKLITIFMP